MARTLCGRFQPLEGNAIYLAAARSRATPHARFAGAAAPPAEQLRRHPQKQLRRRRGNNFGAARGDNFSTARRNNLSAARGDNVETLHPVETFHTDRRFCFRQTKSFHANDRLSPDGRAAARRTVLTGTTPPLSKRHCPRGG